MGEQPYVPELDATRTYVKDIKVDKIEHVWQLMQAENWQSGEHYNGMLNLLEQGTNPCIDERW